MPRCMGRLPCLPKSERAHVKATIVNRFKGEARYFTDGVRILEEITGLPVAGVVPYMEISLPEEDACVLNKLEPHSNYESEFNTIAAAVRKALNMELIYKILHEGIEIKSSRGL